MKYHGEENASDELESVLEHAVQSVLSEPFPDDAVERVRARAKGLGSPAASSRLPSSAGRRRSVRYGGLAAAVALVITAGGWLLIGQSAGRAFADVIKNVQRATSLEVTATMCFGEGSEKIKMYMTKDRLRMEQNDGQLIVVCDLTQGTALYQDVRRERYQLDNVSERLANQIMSPIDQLRRAKPDDAEHVGEERVGGRLAELYRMRNAEFMGAHRRGEMLVWVDPTSRLPVRIVIRGPDRSGKNEVRFEDFRWNRRLDERLFALEPPKDYVKGSVLSIPSGSSAEASAPTASPSQLPKGVLTEDRMPFRVVWAPRGSTLWAITHKGAALELVQWDVESRKADWSVFMSGPYALASTADGTRLGTVRDDELQLRGSSTGKITRRWRSDKKLSALAFSPDGKTLAVGVSETKPVQGGVQIWDVEQGKLKHSWSEDGVTRWVRYSPDGKYVAGGSPNVKVWEAETGELVRVLPDGDVFDFSPDGKHIACRADKRCHVRIYEWQTGKALKTLASEDTTAESCIMWIDFSPDGRLVAAADWNGTATLWDVATGEVVKTITDHDGGVFVAVFSPDSKTLATGSEDKTLRLWSVDELVEK